MSTITGQNPQKVLTLHTYGGIKHIQKQCSVVSPLTFHTSLVCGKILPSTVTIAMVVINIAGQHSVHSKNNVTSIPCLAEAFHYCTFQKHVNLLFNS